MEWLNGKICTIVEMVRCMLKGKGLPNTFWAEAVNTIAHVLNRSLTKSINGRILEEARLGENLDIHFKVFGCNIFVHIPKGKIDVKGPNVFLFAIVKCQKHIKCMILLSEK
jgi:hypothetical protein